MISTICSFLSVLLLVYSFAFWIRAFLSWFPESQNSPFLFFINKITDPVLNFFRKFRRKNSVVRIDFSFLYVFMVINILRTILSVLGTTGRITVWYILAIIIHEIWAYTFRFIFIVLLIIIGIRMIIGFSKNQNNYIWKERLNVILRSPVNFTYRLLSPIYKLFTKGREVSEQTEIIISFIFYLIVYILLRLGINLLVGFLINL